MKRRLSVAVAAAVAAASITAAPAIAEPNPNANQEAQMQQSNVPSSGSSDSAAGYAVAGISGVLGAALAIGLIVAADPSGIEKAADMFGIHVNLPF